MGTATSLLQLRLGFITFAMLGLGKFHSASKVVGMKYKEVAANGIEIVEESSEK